MTQDQVINKSAAAMRFYGYFRSSSSYRLRIACGLKNLSYEFTPVPLTLRAQHEAEFVQLNPQRLLPILVTPEGAVLRQSLAILEWLEERHPTPALLPKDLVLRAQVRGFAQAIACEIHPLQNLRVLDYLRLDVSANETMVSTWLRHWIGQGLQACEALLQEYSTEIGIESRFCFGDAPGLADVCLVPQVFSAERFGVDIGGLTRVQAVCAACAEIDAFAAAHPAQQPDCAA